MSKRITITIHDDIDELTAMQRATSLIECSPSKEHHLYWADGYAACFSWSAKGTAIHVYKSEGYKIYAKKEEN